MARGFSGQMRGNTIGRPKEYRWLIRKDCATDGEAVEGSGISFESMGGGKVDMGELPAVEANEGEVWSTHKYSLDE